MCYRRRLKRHDVLRGDGKTDLNGTDDSDLGWMAIEQNGLQMYVADVQRFVQNSNSNDDAHRACSSGVVV